MTKKERVGGEVGRLIGIVLVLFVFIALRANVGHAYEREIILGDAYQTEKEKERLKGKWEAETIKPEEGYPTKEGGVKPEFISKEQAEKVSFKDRFKLDLSFGYGFSYATTGVITGLYGLDKNYQTYLDKLGMNFSDNYFQLRLTATYLLSPKMGIYLGAPGGVVKEESTSRFEEGQISAGVGDAYGGIFYNVLSETNYRPNVIVNFDVNSNIAKFSSLGDGLWDFTPGIRVSKFVPGSKSVYLFGVSDYTFRLEENNVKPGGVIGYGGGMGYFFSGRDAIESELKAYRIGETEINSKKVLDANNDLIFSLTYKSSFWKGSNMSLTLGNLGEGFDIKTNTLGFEWSVPVF